MGEGSATVRLIALGRASAVASGQVAATDVQSALDAGTAVVKGDGRVISSTDAPQIVDSSCSVRAIGLLKRTTSRAAAASASRCVAALALPRPDHATSKAAAVATPVDPAAWRRRSAAVVPAPI